MSKFGFLTSRTAPHDPVSSPAGAGRQMPRMDMASPAEIPAAAFSEEVQARLGSLRGRLHQQLSGASRDYAILQSIRSSKIAYCDTVTRELTRRLAANPYFEVLQHLDEAQAQIARSSLGGGR